MKCGQGGGLVNRGPMNSGDKMVLSPAREHQAQKNFQKFSAVIFKNFLPFYGRIEIRERADLVDAMTKNPPKLGVPTSPNHTKKINKIGKQTAEYFPFFPCIFQEENISSEKSRCKK